MCCRDAQKMCFVFFCTRGKFRHFRHDLGESFSCGQSDCKFQIINKFLSRPIELFIGTQ